ncbi:MAG TPA: hypothetical protein PLS20_08855, partial [Ruminococcus flavefaciens]|nr:hypothetical protein [Ruminococcus flavefaciens]
MNETVYWLWLSMVFGTCSRRIWEAMCFFETATEAYCELSAENCRLNLTQDEIANIRIITLDQVRSLMEESEKKGVQHGKGKGHGSVTGTIRPSVAIPMAKTFRLAGANLLTESPIRQNASLKHLKPPKPPEIAG